MPREIVFCFVEGEPALYLRKNKSYHLLIYTYDEILERIKVELLKRNFKTRPQFIVILNILSEQFNCSEGYSPNLNKKTYINNNSFESKFTRDITEFIDSIFKRSISDEEKELRKKEKEWLNNINRIPTRVFRIKKAKLEAQKRNFKI